MTQTLTFFIHQIAVHENVQATIYDALQDQENKPGESLASHPYIKVLTTKMHFVFEANVLIRLAIRIIREIQNVYILHYKTSFGYIGMIK